MRAAVHSRAAPIASKWEHARFGATRVWWRTYGRFAESILAGNMNLESAHYLQTKLDALIAAERSVVGFHDWWDVPSYETEARISWQAWLGSTSFEGAHFLTPSRLLQMGIIVANLAYPSVKFVVYKQRAAYERSRGACMPAVRSPI